MKIKQLLDEDFVNYKKVSMFIGTSICDWKCCTEQNIDQSICQNYLLANSETIDISADEIFRRYISNDISKSIVIGGLEPILQFSDVLNLIYTFRNNGCFDEFIIYTGYYPNEIPHEIEELMKCENIIIKYGRFTPNQEKHFDNVLGIWLASDNQYAERLS